MIHSFAECIVKGYFDASPPLTENSAIIREDERKKVLEELHVALHTIPIMTIGPGVIFSPTINYVDKVIIESLRKNHSGSPSGAEPLDNITHISAGHP